MRNVRCDWGLRRAAMSQRFSDATKMLSEEENVEGDHVGRMSSCINIPCWQQKDVSSHTELPHESKLIKIVSLHVLNGPRPKPAVLLLFSVHCQLGPTGSPPSFKMCASKSFSPISQAWRTTSCFLAIASSGNSFGSVAFICAGIRKNMPAFL